MADDNSTEVIEDEAARHRRERRELQSTIQHLKKSVNKNDKARKKKVDMEVKTLEEAFEQRWVNFNEHTASMQPDVAVSSIPTSVNETVTETHEPQHASRKARRAANKEKRRAEANANQEDVDYDNLPESIRLRDESSSIEKQLHDRGLELFPIPADGNCLFASIAHQISDVNLRQLRESVAEYLRKHRSEYEPFIEMDYDTYCDKVARENIWGGQIELQICAKILQRSVEVIQGDGNPSIKIDNSSSQPPIVITYHRYLYANGEHYNSTISIDDDSHE